MKILTAIGRWLGGEGLRPVLSSVRGPSDSLVQSVPYIFAGLAVALGFRGGLFNIGAEGQIGVGWLVAVVVGFSLGSLPAVILLPLAIVAGAAAAGLWAAIAGLLKAKTGAHEVITTIMLNYVLYRLSEWLLCGPLEFGQGTCRTEDVSPHAPHAIRVITEGQQVAFVDGIQGPIEQNVEHEVGDFVLRRADGFFAYQLAVVVDDAAQGITEIVRGSDLLDSTARQIVLQRLLGYSTPAYHHLPVAVNELGQKLSKQTFAPALSTENPLPTLWLALRFC